MCMVNYSVIPTCRDHFYLMVHQMGWQFGGWSATVHQPPHDMVVFPFLIQLDDTDGILRFDDHIAEIFTAYGYNKIFLCKFWNCRSDRLPFFRFKIFLYGFHFFQPDTIGKVSAISLVPSLLPSIVCRADKILYKFCI